MKLKGQCFGLQTIIYLRIAIRGKLDSLQMEFQIFIKKKSIKYMTKDSLYNLKNILKKSKEFFEKTIKKDEISIGSINISIG